MKNLACLVSWCLLWCASDAEAPAHGGRQVVRPAVRQRDAAPGRAARRPQHRIAAAAQPGAAGGGAAPAAAAPKTPVGRHAGRPGRRPGPGLAGAFARAWAPPSATVLLIACWPGGFAVFMVHAFAGSPRAAGLRVAVRLPGRRRCRCDGPADARARRKTTALTRLGNDASRPAVGAQQHGLDASRQPVPQLPAAHDRLGPRRFAELGRARGL